MTVVGQLADTPWLAASRAGRVATVTGRNRLPSDVVGELMDVLVEQPRVVVCDLSGLAVSPVTMVEVFAPVAPYLAGWPGTLVVACVPEPTAHAQMLPAAITNRLLVHARCEDGVQQARRLLRPLHHTMTYLPPVPEAAADARTFATGTLRDWRLSLLDGPARLVVSELVTDSLLRARTVLGLSLSRCENLVRIAVHDHSESSPMLPTAEASEETWEGRGLLLVQALTRRWGVLPTRAHGKTVWAVMDAA